MSFDSCVYRRGYLKFPKEKTYYCREATFQHYDNKTKNRLWSSCDNDKEYTKKEEDIFLKAKNIKCISFEDLKKIVNEQKIPNLKIF